jgi:cysteine desulfurase family protein
MKECIDKYGANPGRSGHAMSIKASEKIYDCRENIAELFNIPNPLCISFTSNTTQAINLGIKGILKAEDHVIISGMEHNSVLRPLKKLENKLGISITTLETDSIGRMKTLEIKEHICPKTRLIITIHASNVNGTINPVEEIGRIARENGIIYMVDAAQTSGIFPIDVVKMNIDMLAFPGHKGLLGPQGTGGLYVREDIVLDTLIEGGTGSMSENPYQPEFTPDRYESGTLNTPGIVGLSEGIKYILSRGIDNIREHESVLTQYLLQGLSVIKKVKIIGSLEPDVRVGVVSFNIDGKDCVEVCNTLDTEYRICARGGLHCAYLAHKNIGTIEKGTIRLGLGIFNTKNDIDIALKAINSIAR